MACRDSGCNRNDCAEYDYSLQWRRECWERRWRKDANHFNGYSGGDIGDTSTICHIFIDGELVGIRRQLGSSAFMVFRFPMWLPG